MSESDGTESATLPILQVRCASWREFAESFVDDLASGGLYVANADPLPPLQAVVVQLLLPEATEIVLNARVVQVVSAAQAERVGKAAGLALELLDRDPERKRQVVQLIEFARWQGASGDPNTSFARTMLELTPSLAPRELALRLSQLPAASSRSDSRTGMPAVQAPRRDSQTSLPAQRSSSRPTVTPGSSSQESLEQETSAYVRTSTLPAAHSGKQPARMSSSHNLPAQARPRADSSRAMPAAPVRPRSESTHSLPAARPRSESSHSLPAVRPRADSQTLPTPSRDAHVRRQSGQTLAPPLDAHMRRQSGQIPAPGREADVSQSLPAPDAGAVQSGVAPAKPTDQLKLKQVLTNVAHKHYEAALAVTREMLADNAGDPQALRWQAMCCARLALQRGETQAARDFYEQLLQLDPNHREAREFIRVHERDRKLNALPFGRYFTKKK